MSMRVGSRKSVPPTDSYFLSEESKLSTNHERVGAQTV